MTPSKASKFRVVIAAAAFILCAWALVTCLMGLASAALPAARSVTLSFIRDAAEAARAKP